MVVEKDLENIKSLLAAMTNILQENLVTLSAHDKGSSDWRGVLLSTAESALARIDQVERAVADANRLHMDSAGMRESIKKGMAEISVNGKLLQEVLGLAPSNNPLPLSRDLREILELMRGLSGADPATGRPVGIMAWWAPRFKEALAHGVVLAALALLFNLLLPYFPWVHSGKGSITMEVVPSNSLTPKP